MSKKSIRTKSPHIHRPSKSNTIQEHPDRKRIPSPLPQFPKSKTISATPPFRIVWRKRNKIPKPQTLRKEGILTESNEEKWNLATGHDETLEISTERERGRERSRDKAKDEAPRNPRRRRVAPGLKDGEANLGSRDGRRQRRESTTRRELDPNLALPPSTGCYL